MQQWLKQLQVQMQNIHMFKIVLIMFGVNKHKIVVIYVVLHTRTVSCLALYRASPSLMRYYVINHIGNEFNKDESLYDAAFSSQ